MLLHNRLCDIKVKNTAVRREFAYAAPEAFGKRQPLGHTFVPVKRRNHPKYSGSGQCENFQCIINQLILNALRNDVLPYCRPNCHHFSQTKVKMKISAFVLLLSMLAHLSFANFSESHLHSLENCGGKDTVSRESLAMSLVGDWTKIGQDEIGEGFTDLSIFADGKFKAHTADGKRVCGTWEISNDGEFLAIHKRCEKTGENTGTLLVQIELTDGHLLTLKQPGTTNHKQTFIL
jgi:hypothetical protein